MKPLSTCHGLLAALVLASACGVSTAEYSLEGEDALTGEVSLWPRSTLPANGNQADIAAVELGLKFRTTTPGKVSGVRFYKSGQNIGTHQGNLWGNDGQLLASVTFSNETRSGWQVARFASPVSIQANTVYIVSYHAPRGRYAGDNGYFERARSVGVLQAPSSSEVGGNGVYRYGASNFPNQTFRSTNYYVDVLFIPESPPISGPDAGTGSTPDAGQAPPAPDTQAPAAPTQLSAAAASSSQVNLSWSAATDNVRVTSYLVFRGGTQVGTTSLTTYSDTGLPFSTSQTYTVRAKDEAGNVSISSNTATATTLGSPTVDCVRSVWSNLEACGWPGATNTGVPAGTTLRTTAARTITVDDTLIEGERIDGGLIIRAKNVTIRNSHISFFYATGTAANGTGVIKILPGASATIEHSTLDGMSGVHTCIWAEGTNVIARNNNCFGANDGVFIWDTDNFTLENNYFHDFTDKTANGHVDGFQTEGASHGLIRHNTFDVAQSQNACIAIWNSRRNSDDILVENNLLAGGGFSIYAHDYSPSEASPAGGYSVTRIRFVNNRFSTVHYGCVGGYGAWFPRGSPTDGWNRTGNIVLETNQNIDNGNPTSGGRVCN